MGVPEADDEGAADAETSSRDAGGAGRLGLARGPRRQRRAPGAHAQLRPPVGDLPARPPRHVRARRRPAGRADGQLRGRPSQHRRRPRRHAGPAAHRRCHRQRRDRARPGPARADRAPARKRRHLPPHGPRLARRRAFASGSRGGARQNACQGRRADRRPCLHRWPRHPAALGGRGPRAPRCGAAAVGARSPRSAAATTPWIATVAGSASPRPTTPSWRARARASPTLAPSIADAYAHDVSDEFVLPAVVGDYRGMRDGDGVLCFNFRADRVREILAALLDPAFSGFPAAARRPHSPRPPA